ncbi:MAG: hypothetical protein R6X02_21835 [Enhygromyxa sp.]
MMLAIFELLVLLSLAPEIGDDCGEQVCIYASDKNSNALASAGAGSFKPDARLSKKQRRAEAKKNRKRKRVAVQVVVEGGRGSAFVDGRYIAGEGPHAERELLPGKHEIEVREGERVIAVGVLTIPRKAAELTLVVHADR